MLHCTPCGPDVGRRRAPRLSRGQIGAGWRAPRLSRAREVPRIVQGGQRQENDAALGSNAREVLWAVYDLYSSSYSASLYDYEPRYAPPSQVRCQAWLYHVQLRWSYTSVYRRSLYNEQEYYLS